MEKIRYLLSDLDGVIRHFPSERDSEIERRFGLPHGALLEVAFEHGLLNQAITGVITDETWRIEIAKALSKRFDPNLAVLAVKEWSAFPGKVDHQYLKYIKMKFPIIPAAILTNGTSRLRQDLNTLRVQDHFFKIFNSAEIGFSKPDRKIFDHVLNDLNCSPSEILFIDDSLSHVNTASQLGFGVHHYRSLEEFQMFMERL